MSHAANPAESMDKVIGPAAGTRSKTPQPVEEYPQATPATGYRPQSPNHSEAEDETALDPAVLTEPRPPKLGLNLKSIQWLGKENKTLHDKIDGLGEQLRRHGERQEELQEEQRRRQVSLDDNLAKMFSKLMEKNAESDEKHQETAKRVTQLEVNLPLMIREEVEKLDMEKRQRQREQTSIPLPPAHTLAKQPVDSRPAETRPAAKPLSLDLPKPTPPGSLVAGDFSEDNSNDDFRDVHPSRRPSVRQSSGRQPNTREPITGTGFRPSDENGSDESNDDDRNRRNNRRNDNTTDQHRRSDRNSREYRDSREHRDDRGSSNHPSREPHITYKIKREEIGIFDPSWEDPDEVGMVFDGKNTIFTDAFSFADRIDSFLEDPTTRNEAEGQLKNHFQSLLAGPSALWWNNELTSVDRTTLRQQGLDALMEALKERFAPDPSTATKDFTKTRLRLKAIAADDGAIMRYIQKKTRLARAMGILNEDNTNWHGVMMQIWNGMELSIRQFLRAPTKGETLAKYMQNVKETRALLNSAASDEYPFVQKMPAKSSRKYPSTGNQSDRKPAYRDSDRDRERRHYDRNRDRSNQNEKNNLQKRDKGNKYEDRRGSGRDRYGKGEGQRERHRDRVHFTNHDDDSDSNKNAASDSNESDKSAMASEEEVSCMVFDGSITCHHCYRLCESQSDKRAHVRKCKPSKAVEAQSIKTPSPADPARRTCGYCSLLCVSRNALFAHLRSCASIKSTMTEPKQEDKPVDTALLTAEKPKYRLEKAPSYKMAAIDNTPLSSYTHLRAQAMTGPDDEVGTTICYDPGTARSIIDRKFLQKLQHSVERRRGNVKGVGEEKLRLSEWATFKIYLPGKDQLGRDTLMEFEKSAWVLDNLQPNLLLGNDFIHCYECVIDYQSTTITYNAVNGFKVDFEVETRSLPCVRKVTTQRKIVLLPGQKAHIPVNYKPLPNDRSFVFDSSHDHIVNAAVNAKSPQVVVAVNTSPSTITIPKRCHVGTINDSTDSGYFVASWANAMKAVTASAAISASLAAAGTPTSVDVDTVQPAPVSAQFELSHLIQAVAEGHANHTSRQHHAWETRNLIHEPTTPSRTNVTSTPTTPTLSLSDQVFNITQGLAPGLPPEGVEVKPRIPEKHSTLGIKMGAEYEEVFEGMHIYSKSKSFARKLKALVKIFPSLWEDKGLIDLPAEQWMKVPLVEGWQNQRVSSRSYPLSRRDREVLDTTFDALHKQHKMKWVYEPTPFAHPVFVVWRMARGKMKGRVVIDLRALNKVSVPDNYPLPLQSSIIEALRGKGFITAIDATSFFYQFGIHPPHQDRFTLISPRGLEKPTVALMGYRNSPAHVQRYMDRLLDKHSSYCRAFIDDIVIFSDSEEDHLRHLRTIFDLFCRKNIAISPTKSYLGYPDVELLGFRVNGLGLSTTKERVAAFRNLAFPDQLKALEQYLGSTGFLRHLIPYYAQLAAPLQARKVALLAEGRKEGKFETGNPTRRTNYCQKTYYTPTEQERLSFEALQAAICSEKPGILYHHDPSRQLFLQVDGSLERGFGVMLFHTKDTYVWEPGQTIPANKVQPVMFLSRCLTKPELRYGPSELEVACLVWAVRKLRTVIHSANQPVMVLTDHSATRGIVEQTTLNTASTDRANRRLINASVYLSQYDLKVYHLPGKVNFVPDALSRLRTIQDGPEQPEGDAILDDVWFAYAEAQMDPSTRAKYIEGYKMDKKYAAIMADLGSKERGTSEGADVFSRPGYPFMQIDGLLYNIRPDGTRSLCVPHAEVKAVLEAAHDDKHHFGRDRMLYELRGLSINNKTYLVKKYVQHCPTCLLNQTDRQPPIGNYQPIKPNNCMPMQVIAIDFIAGLPRVPSASTPWQLKGHEEYDNLLTATDKATKRSLLIPGHSTYSAEEWGTVFMRQLVLSDWGVPNGIISDRDRKFTSEIWKGMWRTLGTKLMMTAAYHPQADGLSERKNQTVEIALRFQCFEHPETSWLDVIPALQWNLNAAYSDSIKSTPHEQLFGFKLPGPLEVTTGNEASDHTILREYVRQDAQLAMDFAAAETKRRYDAHHRPLEFKEGDQVYLRLHHGYYLAGKPPRKYSQQRAGPFKIVKRVGRLAYELDFPPNMKIHPVISVAHLSPQPDGKDPFNRTRPPPGPVEAEQTDSGLEDGEEYEVERISNHRPDRNKKGFQYLIKWKGWGSEHDVWKTEWQLRHSPELVSQYWKQKGERPAKGTDLKEGKEGQRRSRRHH
jgi:hypothetical protein